MGVGGWARRRLTAGVGVVLATAVIAGCTADDAPSTGKAADPAPEPTATPLAALDLSGLAAIRAPFCEALDRSRVAEVLGGRPRRSGSYEPGDRVRFAPGVEDVANEYGCTFGRGRTTARAWLFGQPVTRAESRQYVDALSRQRTCSPGGPLRFGRPGLVLRCRPGDGSVVTMAGRFGQGWLTCQVAAPVPAARLLEPAQRWCADVATTVATP